MEDPCKVASAPVAFLTARKPKGKAIPTSRPGQQPSSGPGPPHCSGFEITFRHSTLSRTPISPSKRPLPDSTQNSQEKELHILARFEPAIPASKRPQTRALDRAATGIATVACSLYISRRFYMLLRSSILFFISAPNQHSDNTVRLQQLF